MPEDFVVPPGYEVPDEIFYWEFVRDAVAATGSAILLTGPPGRGKSTYLARKAKTLCALKFKWAW